MFCPLPVLSVRKWVHLAKSVLGQAALTDKKQRRMKPGWLRLEPLEDRTLLSAWAAKGPAPILNAAPGGDPASGRIAAVAADPADLNTLYIAAAGGGVWKTSNGGTTWTPLTDDQQTLFMGAITLAPTDPNIIYAGTGEGDNSGDSFYGRGVLKSTDAGATWTLLGNRQFDRKTISQIVVSPTDANTVYVAVGGLGVNGISGGTGIWKSSDGGVTWANMTTAITTSATYSDVQIDPLDPQTIYAAIGEFDGSSANGIYKTTNGGKSWALVGNAPKGNGIGNAKIAIAPSNDLVLYASFTNPSTGSLARMMKSVDGGLTWKQLTATPNYMGQIGWYASTLAVDPTSPDTVYAGGQASVVRSLNGGTTWSDISAGFNGHGPHPDHHGIGFDAAGRLLDGNDGGIWRLDNSSPVRWSDLNGNLQITQFVGIALHPSNPNMAYGGSQDNGTEEFVGSLPWELTAGGDGGFVRIDFNNPQTVYHTFYYPGNGFLQRSDNGGASWLDKTNGINKSDVADFYPPYVMDPSNSSRLLLGTDRVYETINRGDSWKPISTPNANGWIGSNPIDCLAIAPSDPNTIYASAGGVVFVTTNHGASWHQRILPGNSISISDLLVDPANSQIAYAVRDQFVFNGGHVFRTTNGGVTWTNISGNLPNLPVHTIVLGNGTLYVGNDDGVYSSTSLGASWNRLGDGLPHVQVRELVLNASFGILAAGTHGRGLWELSLGGLVTHFRVTPSTNPVTAGASFQVVVAALNDQGNTVTGYSGTVHFTSSDSGAVLPGNYTFTTADGGVHAFDVTFITAGSQTITAADSANGLSNDDMLTVKPATADHFSISAPAGSTAGTTFDITVTALDPYNNIAVAYQGTVHFTTSDAGAAVLPPDLTFTAADAGAHVFPGGVTLVTAGSQTIMATDTVSAISGRGSVAVSPATPDHLLVIAPATVFSGVAFDVTVTVQDAFNNTVTGYLGIVQFTSADGDPGVLLPADYSFTRGDGGAHTFAGGVTLITLGNQTLSVKDPSLGITGTVTVSVLAPAAPPGGRHRAHRIASEGTFLFFAALLNNMNGNDTKNMNFPLLPGMLPESVSS
jgi:photosystem II stability/assembly factor-like uncharacterized protein